MSKRKNKNASVIDRAPFDADKTISPGVDETNARTIALSKMPVTESGYIEDLKEFTNVKFMPYLENNRLPEFVKEFKMVEDQYCWLYFPNYKLDGKPAPTYIDRAETRRDMEVCAKKAALMQKLGKRYLVYRQKNPLAPGQVPTTEQAMELIGEGF